MKPLRPICPFPATLLVAVACGGGTLAVTTPAQDWSGSSPYISRNWQKDDGLPQNSVSAVVQSSDGYLWAATSSGLARFNGVEFKVFDSRNTPALKSSRITGLCAAPDGGLWIGTAQGGLTRLKEGRFECFTVDSGPSAAWVRCLVGERDGVVGVGATDSLFALRGGKLDQFSLKVPGGPGDVRAVCSDYTNGLWIGTASRGVYHLSDGKVAAVLDTTSGLPHNSVRSLCLSRSGTLWVGTMLGVVGLGPTGAPAYFGPAAGLSDRIVTALYEDRRGTLWIGTAGGLHHVTDGKLFRDLDEGGAPYTAVAAITDDAEGNVWVGTREGLHRLQPRRFRVYTTQQGLSHNNVTAVLEDKEGAVWFATYGSGVCKLEHDVLTSYSRSNGFTRDLIIALGQDHTGTMWAGADLGAGLYHYQVDGTRVRMGRTGPARTVRAICEDRQTNLWVGTSAGLYRFAAGQTNRYTMKEGLPSDTIRALCEDRAGTLWVGTAQGLCRWQNGALTSCPGANGLAGRTVFTIREDAGGDLWLGTDGGLARTKNGKLTIYTTEQGLFNNEVFSVLDDARGNLWMGCPNGIFSVARKSLDELDHGTTGAIRCISYGKHDGMVSLQCSGVGQPPAWKGTDGSLWFTTLRGAAMIPADTRLEPNDKAPPVFIEEVLCDRKPADGSASNAAGDAFPLGGSRGSFAFPPGRGELEFHYAALSFKVPEKNCFQYRLEGEDSQWVTAGARRVAYYNNLAPGAYRFRVRACNNDGVWNEQGAFVNVILRPHYWQTWWFRVLAGAVLVGLAAGTGRYVERRRLREQMRRLEQDRAMERERARIARDIHDDLGARLTKISKLSEQAQRLAPDGPANEPVASIQSTAQEMLGRLDETVWAVNPRNDRLDRLADYILNYAEEFFRPTNMRCRLKVTSEIPPLPIAAEPRHHLFLAVKEALNNAARHSGASEVQVRLEFAGGVFRVQVRDNGRGFNAGEALARGRGLENMRSRLESLSGQWEVQSRAGQGTTIKMEYSVPDASAPAEAPAP